MYGQQRIDVFVLGAEEKVAMDEDIVGEGLHNLPTVPPRPLEAVQDLGGENPAPGTIGAIERNPTPFWRATVPINPQTVQPLQWEFIEDQANTVAVVPVAPRPAQQRFYDLAVDPTADPEPIEPRPVAEPPILRVRNR